MDSVNHFVAPKNHLVGWTAIVGTDNYDIRSKINAGLDAFAGEYGLNKEIIERYKCSIAVYYEQL